MHLLPMPCAQLKQSEPGWHSSSQNALRRYYAENANMAINKFTWLLLRIGEETECEFGIQGLQLQRPLSTRGTAGCWSHRTALSIIGDSPQMRVVLRIFVLHMINSNYFVYRDYVRDPPPTCDRGRKGPLDRSLFRVVWRCVAGTFRSRHS